MFQSSVDINDYHTLSHVIMENGFMVMDVFSYCQFLGHCAFSFPLSEMREHVSELAGARLAVSTDVFDWWFLELKSASMNSYVIESGVKIRFLGGKYRVFKPGNPFKVQASTGSTSFCAIESLLLKMTLRPWLRCLHILHLIIVNQFLIKIKMIHSLVIQEAKQTSLWRSANLPEYAIRD